VFRCDYSLFRGDYGVFRGDYSVLKEVSVARLLTWCLQVALFLCDSVCL